MQYEYRTAARGGTLSGAVAADITVLRHIPDSYAKSKRREMANAPCMVKPDCDNIAKAVLDALNGVAYHDDAQVTRVSIEKRWTEFRDSVIVVLEVDYERKDQTGE